MLHVKLRHFAESLQTVVQDTVSGFVVITRNCFVLLGLATVFMAFVLFLRPDLRQAGEEHLRAWLQARHFGEVEPAVPVEPLAAERATAQKPDQLTLAQVRVTFWLSQRYKVGVEPMTALVAEAYRLGEQVRLDPLLMLSVMAAESRFNPFAQSHAGAQGLMQVMTSVHNEKYEYYGGDLAAFDPITNLRVGVMVLKDCIRNAGGAIEDGLRHYVGAANHGKDGGYVQKVMAEYERLQKVAEGGINVRLPDNLQSASAPSESEADEEVEAFDSSVAKDAAAEPSPGEQQTQTN